MDNPELNADARQVITDSLLQFYHLVDMGRAAETVGLFTADATITFGTGAPKPGRICGNAIRTAMEARQAASHVKTRHQITNLQMELRPDSSVMVSSTLTLFRSEEGSRYPHSQTIADITERVVFERGSWRIAERVVSPVFY